MPDISISSLAIAGTSTGPAMGGPGPGATDQNTGRFAEVLDSLASIPTPEVPAEMLPGINELILESLLLAGKIDLAAVPWLPVPAAAENVPSPVQDDSDSLNGDGGEKTEPTGTWEALWAAGFFGGASLLPEPAIVSVTGKESTSEDVWSVPSGAVSVPATTGTAFSETPVQVQNPMTAATGNIQAVEPSGFTKAVQSKMSLAGKETQKQIDAGSSKPVSGFEHSESVKLMGSESIQAIRPLKTNSSENDSAFVPQPFVKNNSQPEAGVQLAEQVSNFQSGLAKEKGETVVLNLPVLQTKQSLNDLQSRFDYHPNLITHQTHPQGNGVSDLAGGDKVSVNRDQLFSQLVEHAKIMVDGGDSQMEISLKPEHLGKVHLKVALENHIISAKFVAESEQVRQVIESNLVQLRKSLNESGVQIDSLVVSTGYQSGTEGFGQQWTGDQGNGQGFGGGSYTVAGWSEDEPVAGQDGNPEPGGDSLINLIA